MGRWNEDDFRTGLKKWWNYQSSSSAKDWLCVRLCLAANWNLPSTFSARDSETSLLMQGDGFHLGHRLILPHYNMQEEQLTFFCDVAEHSQPLFRLPVSAVQFAPGKDRCVLCSVERTVIIFPC